MDGSKIDSLKKVFLDILVTEKKGSVLLQKGRVVDEDQ
jgi:hypothetical protein